MCWFFLDFGGWEILRGNPGDVHPTLPSLELIDHFLAPWPDVIPILLLVTVEGFSCRSQLLKWKIFHHILLMEGILHQLIDTVSHYFRGFIYPRWCRFLPSTVSIVRVHLTGSSCCFGREDPTKDLHLLPIFPLGPWGKHFHRIYIASWRLSHPFQKYAPQIDHLLKGINEKCFKPPPK